MKALHVALGLLATSLLVVLALLGMLWLWSGSGSSLATALDQAQRYLPPGQTIEVKEVLGSLRGGGSIGWLRWRSGELSVELRDVKVAWALPALREGELRLGQLSIRQVRIEDHRPASIPTAPTDLRLPLRVDAPFVVDELQWVGPAALQLSELTGHYRFDGKEHSLDIGTLRMAAGSYRGSGRLSALPPMALALQVLGSVQTTPPSSSQSVTLNVDGQLQGNLAGSDATLQLQAQVVPELKAAQAMQANVTTRLQPWQPQPVLQATAKWRSLDLAALWPQAPQTLMHGEATVTPAGQGWHANIQLNNSLSGPWSRQRLPIEALDARLVYLDGGWTFESLNATGAGGRIAAQGKYSAAQALQGQLALSFPGASAAFKGHLASASGQGELSLLVSDAGLASRWLAQWPGMPAALSQTVVQGSAEVSGHWQGGWQKQGQEMQIQASVRAPNLVLRGVDQTAEQAWRLRDGQADVTGTLGAFTLSASGQADNATRHFALKAQAQGGRSIEGVWQGQLDSAQVTLQDSLRPGLWTLQLNERVALDWKRSGSLQALNINGGSVNLSGPLAGTAAVRWQAVQWSQQRKNNQLLTQWQSQGSLQGLPLAWIDLLGQTTMAKLGLSGDLLFGGQWDVTQGASDEQLRLRATLERSSGDLQLQLDATDSGVGIKPVVLNAGVRAARLLLSVDGQQLAASLNWDSERAGQVQADISSVLQRQDGGWAWPVDAPLSGTLKAQLPSNDVWSLLVPPGWRLRGTLAANATLSGKRGAPQWLGTLQAQDMALRSVADGIDFSQGTLRASLAGQRLSIDQFTLHGAGGSSGGLLLITGSVLWLPATPALTTPASHLRMALQAEAQSLRLSQRADRRLVLSGKLTAKLDDAQLVIGGALKADEALFILPEDSVPQLGDDVVVRSSTQQQARTESVAKPMPTSAGAQRRVTPDVAVTLDLGSNFEVRGRGLATRLAGTLELRNTPQQVLTPRLSGQLRTVGGTYLAYGQQLDIEEGVLRFVGPYDNPALDILALRPNLQQRVGVQISGTALSPVLRLYSEPDLPEAEKLAWLVLGRSAANGGAESAMLQQAALALLGGKGRGLSGGLAQAIGLDELSVRGIASTNADGSTTAPTVTLGKRVSRNFYVAYERSLAGTMGTFYIFYDLSRRFTLRAQTGEQSAVDLIFTLRYD